MSQTSKKLERGNCEVSVEDPVGSKEDSFFERLARAPRALLMLDYDGTLAPFAEKRLEARLYPGVRERLDALVHLERRGLEGDGTAGDRVVLISGRRARELQALARLEFPIEIWGSHGREHLDVDGSYWLEPVSPYEQQALDAIKLVLKKDFPAEMLESKPHSVAIHWRDREQMKNDALARVTHLCDEYRSDAAREEKLQLLSFDGGVELRVGQGNKGQAADKLLRAMPDDTLAAFLGDDVTDEDAFGLLRGKYEQRSLSVLVRKEPRVTAAEVRISPPEELLTFLDRWLECRRRAKEGR
jgi:trehalose-phosphatase